MMPEIVGRCRKCGREFLTAPEKPGIWRDYFGYPKRNRDGTYSQCNGIVDRLPQVQPTPDPGSCKPDAEAAQERTMAKNFDLEKLEMLTADEQAVIKAQLAIGHAQARSILQNRGHGMNPRMLTADERAYCEKEMKRMARDARKALRGRKARHPVKQQPCR